MDRLVNLEVNGSAAILTMMNPPVNALSRALAEALREAFSNTNASKIILTGSGKLFVAGADIREIEKITKRELPPDMSYLNSLLNHIERSGKLVIMAMNGTALGIGLELAMAGHYRILHEKAAVGLPEVNLGLIPGAGGTQRLPRLAGTDAALRICLTGANVDAKEALRLGIVDELCAGDVVARALAISSGRRTDQLPCSPGSPWPAYTGGQRSPLRAIAAIQAAVESATFEEGLRHETRLFEEALLDRQARAMVYLFFAERDLSKIPFLPKDTLVSESEAMCPMRSSPSEFGAKVVEVMWEDGMKPEALAASLAHVKKQGKLAVLCVGGLWVGKPDMDAEEARRLVQEKRVLRAGDLDVLLVRGFGYPEELGGPIHQSEAALYSTTPNHTSESVRDPLK
jgi:enoyl-CoA hydratase/carnithine racemase